jgi:hypothetical protein
VLAEVEQRNHLAGEAMNSSLRRHARVFTLVRSGLATLCAALSLGCGGSDPTAPQEPLPLSDIHKLRIFVRNSSANVTREYVQIEFERIAGRSMLLMYRPRQLNSEGQQVEPRILLDSIGPQEDVPAEIVEIVSTFNVWAMADSNAAGAACSTRTGQWVCNPTFNDYSLVLGVETVATRRSQRYTGLNTSAGNKAARALGDFVFAWSRRVAGSPAGSGSY